MEKRKTGFGCLVEILAIFLLLWFVSQSEDLRDDLKASMQYWMAQVISQIQPSQEMPSKELEIETEIEPERTPDDIYFWIREALDQGQDTFTMVNADKSATPESVILEIRQAIEGTYLAAVLESYEVTVNKTLRGDEVEKSRSEVVMKLHHSMEEEALVQAWAEKFAQTLEGADREKVTQIYEKIIRMTSYDEGDENAQVDGVSVHSPYAIIKHGKGVCQAYASLFQLVCEKAKIPCRYRTGRATRPDGLSELHAWNLVLVEGTWWGVDATWGDPVFRDGHVDPDHVNYDYLLTDLSGSHVPDELPADPVENKGD